VVARQASRLDLIDELGDASQRRAPLLTIATLYLVVQVWTVPYFAPTSWHCGNGPLLRI